MVGSTQNTTITIMLMRIKAKVKEFKFVENDGFR